MVGCCVVFGVFVYFVLDVVCELVGYGFDGVVFGFGGGFV